MIEPRSPSDHYEHVLKVRSQSGMGRRVIEAKWPGFREVFADFDPVVVADFGSDEVDPPVADTRIVRNRRKIDAAVHDSRVMIEHGDLAGYEAWLASHGDYEATSKALRRAFRFLGEGGVYHHLYVVGYQVPPHGIVFDEAA